MNSTLKYISLFLLIIILAACSKDTIFFSQKYTHFKKSKGDVVFQLDKQQAKNIPTVIAYSLNETISHKNIESAQNVEAKIISQKNTGSLKIKVKSTLHAQTTFNKNEPLANENNKGSVGPKEMQNEDIPAVALILIAIFIPVLCPLVVFLAKDKIDSDFWINLLLTLLCLLPGMIHAIVIASKYGKKG